MSCPDLEELESYASSRLDASARSALADHLATCPECSSQLGEITESLRVLGPLRELFATAGTETGELPREVGSYRLLRELGRGGNGVVYEAEQRDPRRRVAVKLLAPLRGADRDMEGLLRLEASALARLRHPSIAAIYEAGHASRGQPFFAMELVEGEPLVAYAQRRKLPLQQRLSLFATVCEAVAYAHQRGVIHRDLKPSNILIEEAEQTGDGDACRRVARTLAAPKILDFGLAKILDLETEPAGPRAPAASEIGRVFGTLPYMSPEHVSGDPHEIDVRSDVYSLGVILFELLTGRLPYVVEHTDVTQAARVIREQPPSDPRTVARDLPDDVATIVLKALEKAPQRRFQSAAEFAADVRRFLRHEPIVARPSTAWYRFRKLVRRNRGLAATVAASVVLLLGTTGAAIGQAVAAGRERDAAQRRLALALHSANYLFFGVSGQVARVPGTDHIRRHIAEESYAFYRRLAEESPEDPMEHAGLWAALRRLVMLSLEDGNLTRAQVLSDEVRAAVEQATDAYPNDPRLISELMYVFEVATKVALRCGDAAAAGQFTDRSVELARQVDAWYAVHTDLSDPNVWIVPDIGPEAGATPPHVQAKLDLARVLVWAAERARDEGDLEGAARMYEEALELTERTMERDPTLEPIYRRDLSDYAPMAGPLLLRIGARDGYERTRATILASLDEIARERSAATPERP
ncbi:MAG: serine/threonine protein kinase [Phycisphaerales bacterium]|nr:MAG: serine/threonine protein kinase [Phycisphaerales bacterium]